MRKIQIKQAILWTTLFISIVFLAVVAYRSRFNLPHDAISYISIARYYAEGDFNYAVNGYWSPMISWLLVPFIKLGFDPRAAFATINLLSSLVVIFTGFKLLGKITSRIMPKVVFILAISVFLGSIIPSFHPDVLLTAWLVSFVFAQTYIYAKLVNPVSIRQKVVLGFCLAAVGAVGYFIKLFALPIFLASLMVAPVIIYYATENSKKYRKFLNFYVRQLPFVLLSVVFFVGLLAPWTVALYIKYDQFTLGSSGVINISSKFVNKKSSIDSARTISEAEKQKIHEKNLYTKPIPEPTNNKAVTALEDLTRDSQKTFGSRITKQGPIEALENYATGRATGVRAYMTKLHKMYPLVIVSALALLLLIVRKNFDRRIKMISLVLLSQFGVYLAGYAMLAGPTGGNARYYWPMIAVSILISVVVICLIPTVIRIKQKITEGGVGVLILIAVVAGFGDIPLKKYRDIQIIISLKQLPDNF